MTYVALLRGINVGGHSKVEMAKLKETFEQLGFDKVKTFINSGNVIFNADARSGQLVKRIEQAIEKDFGLSIKVLVRNLKDIEALVKTLPSAWVNDQAMKCDVMFLWEEIDNRDILKQLPTNPDIEDVKYTKGAVIWRIERDKVRKSRMFKVAGTDLYKKMTIRNPNTVRKLHALMVETAG